MNFTAKFGTVSLLWLFLAFPAAPAQAGEIRGFPAGQAVYYNGYYGAAPSYAYATPQTAYYAPAYPAQRAYYPSGVAVAPARAAYYAPPANYGYAGYPPVVAYYAPASPGYALSPAGVATQGAEAYAYYGQQTPLNYVPPTYRYQTRIVQVPVTYYRPVTVYDPVTAAPTTCQKACTGTQCQPSRFRLFPWLHSSSSCAGGACTAYSCTSGGCPAPYYNTVPAATVPATVVPAVPRGILAPQRTIAPPPTGAIGPGITVPGSTIPADTRPALPPNSVIPNSSTPTIPFNPSPPSSFGSGTSSGYAPEISTPAFGSNFRSSGSPAPRNDIQLNRPAITEPGQKLESTLRPVPDPDGNKRTKPGSRAPQLLNPGDRTAKSEISQSKDATWGVVPATWPARSDSQPHQVNFKVPVDSPQPASAAEEIWDDSGWKSAAR